MHATVKTMQVAGLSTSLATQTGLARGLQLRVVSGPSEGRAATVGVKPVRVGAGGDCELVITDPAVSRRHAEVIPTRGGVLVRDLKSTNGTYVGDVRIQEARVSAGGAFRIGETEVRVVDGGQPQIPPSKRGRFGSLIADSRPMREVFAVLELASPSEATILLDGPSGTGKELTARAIHDHSQRADGPFIIFDCGTVSKDLITSALMGHKKGAFTGATSDRPGAFVEATGGTIFLDEIGELPLECQTQLLRALESRHVIPVGGDRPRNIDCRVVAATNRDLVQMVEEGTFRLDLLHRIAVVHMRLPALKDRLEDLPALIRGFYEGRGMDPGRITGPNLDRLRAHPFEGNVRELRNILERSLVLAGPNTRFEQLHLWLGPQVGTPSSTPGMQIDTALPFKDAKEKVVEAFEAQYLPQLLAEHDDNISAAARHSGLSRRHLRALLVKHGLRESSDD